MKPGRPGPRGDAGADGIAVTLRDVQTPKIRKRTIWFSSCAVCGDRIDNLGSARPRVTCSDGHQKIHRARRVAQRLARQASPAPATTRASSSLSSRDGEA